MRVLNNQNNWGRLIPALLLGLGCLMMLTGTAWAASGGGEQLDLTTHWAGWVSLVIFAIAYVLVIAEENLHLRKSKPVMVAAGVIWGLVALVYSLHGDHHTAEAAVRHNLLEYAELFLFLLAAMTYINTMDERGVFNVLRAWLVGRGFSMRQIFWITGALAFVISPIADNLTTALLMATVIMAVGGKNHKFVAVGCINIVVSANAGGAFSPFGDITTLMVWQKGIVQFQEFFVLFVPSLVNWLVPAFIMGLTVPREMPDAIQEKAEVKYGGWVIVGMFILTISMAVCAHNFLHLPPVLGMMTGLGLLKMYGYFLKRRHMSVEQPIGSDLGCPALSAATNGHGNHENPPDWAIHANCPLKTPVEDTRAESHNPNFNIFKSLERAEWDTLMFFYGIILCVGGLGTMGYLSLGSQLMYGDLGPTGANILVGFLSAIVDNIPVMFAVLAMLPEMSHNQWLLVTLTAGVGGSMLSIGSAAGVAVMGQARGIYTFFAHLKWCWAIALGYAASIVAHILINGLS